MINTKSHVLNIVNISLKYRRKIIIRKHIDKNIILFLFKNNLIFNAHQLNKHYHLLTNLNMFCNIKNLYRGGAKLYISHNQIIKKKLHLHPTIYIISSSNGLISQHEAIKKKCGGFFVGKILIG